MSYIGASPNSAAFLTDQFSGNGSTTTFALSTAPAGTSSILVSVSGVLQDPTTYSVVGTTLTLGGAAPAGTGNISVRYLGIPAAGVVTTAYRTVTEFTATAGQTTFTPPSYTPGYISVFLNGARLGSSDFTATNGTTIVLATGASVDDLVVTESFYVSSVVGAIPNIPSAVSESNISDAAISTAKLSDSSVTTNKLASNAVTSTKVDTTQIATLGTSTGYNVNYLIVGGGGAGGGSPTTSVTGGGGGAGGFLSGVSSLTVGTAYTITVGAGGSTNSLSRGNNGGDSIALGLTAYGGGGGGGPAATSAGLAGGSGGGSAGWYTGTVPGGAGVSGQGFNGGTGGGYENAGGGGGASKAGGNQGTAEHYYTGGDGGAGKVWPINGVTYAGGGGGGSKPPNNTFYYIGGGLPGAGGGGYGGDTVQYSGNQGVTNTGGGGGGAGAYYGGSTPDRQGANGGSGIVIIAYFGAQRGSGGTITSVNGYTLHTFTTSGTYTA